LEKNYVVAFRSNLMNSNQSQMMCAFINDC
jgi:hypothetical protein